MPVLQNKLVMRSIEALHDEALTLVHDTASNRDVATMPVVLHNATPQGSTIDTPKDTLAKDTPADDPTGPASDQDILARIDILLKKLDEDDDVTIAPLTNEGPRSIKGNVTSDADNTTTGDSLAIDNPVNYSSSLLSDAANQADGNAIMDATPIDMAEDTADKPFHKTIEKGGDDAINETSYEILADDQPDETAPPNQAQALADIAAAIYQARQQAVDTVVTDASQNKTIPFDMDVLLAAVADEVRRTISAMMIAELPQMVRDAVGEAVRALPADARSLSTPTTGNPSATKNVAGQKAVAIKKATAKKTKTKKTRTKKTGTKKSTSKKIPTKKTAPST